jgi:hypothetical protein
VDDDFARCEDEARCTDAGVRTGIHGSRPRVGRPSSKHDEERAGTDDRRDDADVDSHALELRPLLDVKLQVAG